jgi:hypothetical protein
LEYSEIPDSNYTAKAIITPRYEGSKMISADYNFGLSLRVLSASISSTEESPLMRPGLYNKYTGERKIQFLDGSTGSWGGDSTGKYPSAVDSRPIYFAHFKSSYENLEKYNTSTFNIDQLIQVPFESIQSEQAPIITSSQLTGNNKNLLSVGSTFTPNRKVKAIYNQASKQFRNLRKFTTPSEFTTISPILDYTTMDGSSNYITFPAQEIISTFTNEKTDNTVSLTQSFFGPVWATGSVNYPSFGPNSSRVIWQIDNAKNNSVYGAAAMSFDSDIKPAPSNSAASSICLYTTGSSIKGNEEGYGLLYLGGSAVSANDYYQFLVSTTLLNYDVVGPHFQIMNSINSNIDRGNYSYSSSTQPWVNGATGVPFSGLPTVPIFNLSSDFSRVGVMAYTPSTFMNGSNIIKSSVLPILSSNPLKKSANKGIQNYFRYNYSQSALEEYSHKNLPLTIEEGDIIRLTYAFVPNAAAFAVDYGMNGINLLNVGKEIVTQEFTVLGYELPPPALDFFTSSLGIDWNDPIGTEIYAEARNLPPTGYFSPDNLKEKFDLIAANTQSMIGINVMTNGAFSNLWSGSVVSCEVMSRWGEISASSNIIAPSGSIKVKFKTQQVGVLPVGGNPQVIMTKQSVLRRSMGGGVNTSYPADTLNTVISSQYTYIVNSPIDYWNADPAFIFDTLKVTPDPSKLQKPIPRGSIMSATHFKRQDNDTKVIVDITQPPESIGVLTPSGDGYLIPDDLTETQKDNVQKIINVLKSQNSFTNPPDANATNDVS